MKNPISRYIITVLCMLFLTEVYGKTCCENKFREEQFDNCPYTSCQDNDTTKWREPGQSFEKIEQRLNAEITAGPVDIDLKRSIGYNNYEGFKTGIGMETNNKLSIFFNIGGYITYGFRDKKIRHGEWIDLYPAGDNRLRLHLGFRDQNLETGGVKLLGEEGVKSDDFIRSLLINNMYTTRRLSGGAELRPAKQLRLYMLFDKSENEIRNTATDEGLNSGGISYNLSRAGLMMRYEPTSGSTWFLNFYQGIPAFRSDYDFTKIELTGKFNFIPSQPGRGIIKIRTGKIWNTVPFPELFNGNGSFTSSFTLLAPYSFATMRINEFMADRFAAIHIKYVIAKLSSSESPIFKPEMAVVQNMGAGVLGTDYNVAPEIDINDYSKGFYETGLEFNNLLCFGPISYGIAAYYRYGPYSLEKQWNNFAFKFGILFDF